MIINFDNYFDQTQALGLVPILTYHGMAEAGVLISIIDPTITSVTVIHELISATQKRIFTSKTPIREVKSL